MVEWQSLILRMDQVQILTGVNVYKDTVEIFVKLVGITKLLLVSNKALRGEKISHKNIDMEDARPG